MKFIVFTHNLNIILKFIEKSRKIRILIYANNFCLKYTVFCLCYSKLYHLPYKTITIIKRNYIIYISDSELRVKILTIIYF